MTYTPFEITGLGDTRPTAALDFIDNFHKIFPKQKGVYELVVKSPFTYDIDVVNGYSRHFYQVKGSFTVLKPFNKDSNLVSIVD